MSKTPVGKTKDAGWQIGLSRTMQVELDDAWDYLISAEGLAVWLGAGVEPPLERGDSYETDDGTRGEIRGFRPHDRIRVSWQPPDRADHAILQIALSPAATGCTFRFHAERLYDNDEREHLRRHWAAIAATIEAALTTNP